MEPENCIGWKNPQRPLSPTTTTAPQGHHWLLSPSATSTQFLNPSSNGGSTPALGSLFQALLSGEIFSQYPSQTSPGPAWGHLLLSCSLGEEADATTASKWQQLPNFALFATSRGMGEFLYLQSCQRETSGLRPDSSRENHLNQSLFQIGKSSNTQIWAPTMRKEKNGPKFWTALLQRFAWDTQKKQEKNCTKRRVRDEYS